MWSERKEEERDDRTVTIKFEDETATSRRARNPRAAGGKKHAVTRIPSSQYAQFCCWGAAAQPADTERTLAENEGLDVVLFDGVSGTPYADTPYVG